MSKAFEIRLRKEFLKAQELQQDPRLRGILNIEYNPRNCGNEDEWVSIMIPPKDCLYPYRFKATYTMPMFVGPGQLEKNWHQGFILHVPEHILMDPNSDVGVSLEGGSFVSGVPFHNHCSNSWICTGSLWEASRPLGISYFFVNLGRLLNMERFVMATGNHLNAEALEWWTNQRHMEPTNKIDWPLDLFGIDGGRSFHFGNSAPTKPSTISFSSRRKPGFSIIK